MKRNARVLFSIVLIASAPAYFFSCKEKENKSDHFNRSSMLEHYANNLITPAYTDLNDAVIDLESSASAFVAAPSENLLIDLQNQWIKAFTSWQYASAYNFGPADEQGLTETLAIEIGTFPASPSKIETAISGTYNLDDFNRDARGFLAVEYLIFNITNDQGAVLASFEEPKRREYLTALIGNIRTRVETVLTAWNGSYKNAFISDNGTDAGSSTSSLYNEFVKSYEALKNYKLGLPLGKIPPQVAAEPERVEAYYSGKSVLMIQAHLSALENIWHGRTKSGADGEGFREYLQAVVGGDDLIVLTEQQLSVIHNALNSLPQNVPLSEQITSDPVSIEALHLELQKHTRYFKSDMSSLLGISITYASGDGD